MAVKESFNSIGEEGNGAIRADCLPDIHRIENRIFNRELQNEQLIWEKKVGGSNVKKLVDEK